MAEETQGIKNKGLLLAAIAVGVVVVIIYNVHIERARRLAEGDRVEVLRYTRDIRAGEVLKPRDLKIDEVDADTAKSIDGWARRRQMDSMLTMTLRQDVRANQPALMGHVVGGLNDRPAELVTPGMVGKTLELDSTTSPGTICRIGDRVNITAIFEVDPGRPQAYRVVSDVKVLSIGGMGPTDPSVQDSRRARSNSRTYRSIMIEVSPDVSLLLDNLQTRLIGDWGVEIRNPADPDRTRPGEISALLRDFAQEANVRRAGTSMAP